MDFRVHSPQATRVELWVYANPTDSQPALTAAMERQPDQAFTCTVPTLTTPVYFGYRAWGPNWPYDPAWKPGSLAGFISDVDSQGNRFNPNKLLFDPYAREISHTPPEPNSYIERATDTGPIAPKGIIFDAPAAEFGTKPTHPFKDDIIYEVHLRGLTKSDPSIPEALRGTYAGAALKAPYLRDLGVTAVEFLPIHEAEAGNYWGYNSVSFFAPRRGYSSDRTAGGPTREWIAMVKAFHDAGLKVYVDVVYNHEGEGDEQIFCLRGLDNPGYLEIESPARPDLYQNDNGVGPNVNSASEPVRNLVLDSLKYWANTLGVDGFRFDLAAVLGNANANGGYRFDGEDPRNILNRAVAELPGVDLIAEPYTATPEGQEQGKFPAGWSEWNDRFRDVFRASQFRQGGRRVTPGEMATRFAGSDDLFRARARHPWNSVNYICSHDGFTLRDLHSYNEPQNDQPYPYGPSEGGRKAQEEMCWDHDGDGAQQMQAVRTALAILLLSAGTPMLTAGSEFCRTQYGNNNPYNLDTAANWLDWEAAAQYEDLTNFTRGLLRFRREHESLRPGVFFTGQGDIAWLRDNGAEVDEAYFADPDKHFLAYRLAPDIYIAYNAWIDTVVATLPLPAPGNNWYVAADTAAPDAHGQVSSSIYPVKGRSFLLLLEKSAAE